MSSKFAIVDIETTGGLRRRNKIIEIGIVVFDGIQIVDQYSSLINPGISIPPFITKITGITDKMVEDAPHFYEIAKIIVEKTEGAVFVAHNVNFDYGFIQEHFRSLGYTYSRKKLCTVQMSRKAWPSLKSHSLGNLIKHFDIKVSARHRALDDAIATTELFKMMLQTENGLNDLSTFINTGIQTTKLPQNITIEMINALPEDTGVYYFKDSQGEIMYIGKAKNIRKRVKQHFSKITNKAQKFQQTISEFDYILTGNELMALLYEDQEIKKLKPRINKAQKNKYQIKAVIVPEISEYPRFLIKNYRNALNDQDEILNAFTSKKTAHSFLHEIVTKYELCECYHDLNKFGFEQCAYNPMTKCIVGPYSQEEKKDYIERFYLAKEHIQAFFIDDFYIIDYGRHYQEYSIIRIENGICTGIGFFEGKIDQIDDLDIHITQYSGNKSTNRMILQYLNKSKSYKIIKVGQNL